MVTGQIRSLRQGGAALVAAMLLGGCTLPPVPTASDPSIAWPIASFENVIRLEGNAFSVDGLAGRYPAGSELVVRVYDAAKSVNEPLLEKRFRNGSGQLPWDYTLRIESDEFAALRLPAVAARLITPAGDVLYRNESAILLRGEQQGNILMQRQYR